MGAGFFCRICYFDYKFAREARLHQTRFIRQLTRQLFTARVIK